MTNYAPSASIQEEVLTFLLSSPTPERIIGFHALNQRLMKILRSLKPTLTSPNKPKQPTT